MQYTFVTRSVLGTEDPCHLLDRKRPLTRLELWCRTLATSLWAECCASMLCVNLWIGVELSQSSCCGAGHRGHCDGQRAGRQLAARHPGPHRWAAGGRPRECARPHRQQVCKASATCSRWSTSQDAELGARMYTLCGQQALTLCCSAASPSPSLLWYEGIEIEVVCKLPTKVLAQGLAIS